MGSSGGSSSTTYMYPEWVRNYYTRANDAAYGDAMAAKRSNPYVYGPIDPSRFLQHIEAADSWLDLQIFNLDPLILYTSLMNSVPETVFELLNRPEIEEIIKGQGAQTTRYVEEEVLPRFRRGMQNIGAVSSSAFKIGEALIWSRQLESMNEKYYDKLAVAAFTKSLEAVESLKSDYFQKLKASMDYVKMHNEVEKAILESQLAYNSARNEFAAAQMMWPVNLNRELVNAAGSWQSTPSSSTTKQKEGGSSMLGAGLGLAAVASSFLDLF